LSFLHALGEREAYADLTVFAALLSAPFSVFHRPGVRLRSGFFGPCERADHAAGHPVAFVPAGFREFVQILARMAPRVMATAAAPPDADGFCSLSLHAGATVDELHRAGADPERLLVVEVHEGLPRTRGRPPEHPHRIHRDEIDVLVEGRHPPLALPDPKPTEVERAIARAALRYVPAGATLQTGIGGAPSQLASLLAARPGGGYGVHSEMFTDGLMALHRAGKVTNAKGVYDGTSIATFAAGSRELYAWLDGREEVRFLPVDAVNTPSVISANRRMVSINAALAVDLDGQVAADTIGRTQYSGIGGHEDFTAGASLAADGRSLVCLPSTARVGGRAISRIQAAFRDGTRVTTPRHQTDLVVTEYGAAELQGASEDERAHALIAIAHPDHRSALAAAWSRRE